MIVAVVPTRDRPRDLERTLHGLGRPERRPIPVVVADDGSDPPARVPSRLANGAPVATVRSPGGAGAAVRNLAAESTDAAWLLMLDDDSWPEDDGFHALAEAAPAEVAAIGGEIRRLDGEREAGGLPEVFVGCGALLRRDAFLAAGGYDADMQYYAEEYDLCARLIAAGHRIVHDDRLRIRHARSETGRDANRLLERLVRNNGWVVARYAPDSVRDRFMTRTLDRCRRIAGRERAQDGYARGMADLEATIAHQPARRLSLETWDRFTGASAARAHLRRVLGEGGVRVALEARGKHDFVLAEVLAELRAEIVGSEHAQRRVVGTLSPGPLRDALDADSRRLASWAWGDRS